MTELVISFRPEHGDFNPTRTEQAEDLRIPAAPADRDPEEHGRYQSGHPGRPPTMVGEPAGGVPQTNIIQPTGLRQKTEPRQFCNFGSRYEWLGIYNLRDTVAEREFTIADLLADINAAGKDRYLHFSELFCVNGGAARSIWNGQLIRVVKVHDIRRNTQPAFFEPFPFHCFRFILASNGFMEGIINIAVSGSDCCARFDSLIYLSEQICEYY